MNGAEKVLTCADCEFCRGTRHSSMSQCHAKYDNATGTWVYAKKTQGYVGGDSLASECRKKFVPYFDWMKVKVIVIQGHIAESLSPRWTTETFLVVEFQGKRYKLRKSDFAEKGTITKTRPKRTFRLIRNPRVKGGSGSHDHSEENTDFALSKNITKKEDGERNLQQELASVANENESGSHACYSLMQYEKYMSEEQDIAFETSGYSERDTWAFDHSAYDTQIRMSILALIQRTDTKYPVPQETTSVSGCNLFERDSPVIITMTKEGGTE